MSDSTLEFLEKMTGYFSNIDENFMGGFIRIIRNFYGDLVSKEVISSDDDIRERLGYLDKELVEDNKVSLNESIEKALAFFRVLGPKYEQMAINVLRDSLITKGDNTTSRAYDVKLSGNESDPSFIVHEDVHSFTVSKYQVEQLSNVEVPEEEYSPIFCIISEINSYVAQFLFYDFYEVKEGVSANRSDMLSAMLDVANLNRKTIYLEKDKEIFEILSGNRAFDESQKVFERFRVAPSSEHINSQGVFSQQMLGLSHPFGIMVACYIYQKILEDSSNIKMFLGLEKAQGVVGDEEVTLRFLENLGIPCFKDGKISLDDECVSLLSEALIKTFDMCNNSKEKVGAIFERCPVVSEQYMTEVNEAWYEAEQKSNRK